MQIRLTALCVLMGTLTALSLRASAQVPESRTDPFVAEATEAIRSPKGAVLVARITGTGIAREGSSWVMHGIAVERVIKTFRNDKGVYFVPTIILENPKEEKSGLKRGALYVVVVKLKRAPYGYLVLTGAREIDGTAGDPVIEILVQEARQRSVFGSSPLLDTFLKSPWDHSGIHTPRADGSVDPVAFGLTTERLLRDIDAALTVAVVSYLRPKRLAGDEEVTDWLCDVVDHLGGPPLATGEAWLIHRPESLSDIRQRAAELPFPYRPASKTTAAYAVVVVDVKVTPPVVKRWVPAIARDDGMIREIRSWIAGSATKPRSESRPR